MPRYDEDNIRNLAERLVEDWDMDTLINYAVERLIVHYRQDESAFHEDWEDEHVEPVPAL